MRFDVEAQAALLRKILSKSGATVLDHDVLDLPMRVLLDGDEARLARLLLCSVDVAKHRSLSLEEAAERLRTSG